MLGDDARRARPFRILMVCTGNLCRSPQAEQLLRTWLEGRSSRCAEDVVVESAGTFAVDGMPMEQQSAEVSRRFGGNPDGHRARRLDRRIMETADLVLVMDREQRRAAVRLLPAAARRCFMLTEFAALLADAALTPPEAPPDWRTLEGPEKHPHLVRVAARRRGLVTLRQDSEVLDPYGQGPEAHHISAQQIFTVLNGLGKAAQDILTHWDTAVPAAPARRERPLRED